MGVFNCKPEGEYECWASTSEVIKDKYKPGDTIRVGEGWKVCIFVSIKNNVSWTDDVNCIVYDKTAGKSLYTEHMSVGYGETASFDACFTVDWYGKHEIEVRTYDPNIKDYHHYGPFYVVGTDYVELWIYNMTVSPGELIVGEPFTISADLCAYKTTRHAPTVKISLYKAEVSQTGEIQQIKEIQTTSVEIERICEYETYNVSFEVTESVAGDYYYAVAPSTEHHFVSWWTNDLSDWDGMYCKLEPTLGKGVYYIFLE